MSNYKPNLAFTKLKIIYKLELASTLILSISAIVLTLWINTNILNKHFIASAGPEKSPAPRIWQIKSVDTVKYSRDLALQYLNDPTFDATIEAQIKSIKDAGATHVAIDTPYDEKFTPILESWVLSARTNGLNVWFRGNFASWEGWFNFPNNLTRENHLKLTREFIQKNPSLFENGDIFTPCPECENGGPGDPRKTGDTDGFRKFMILENQASDEEFKKIGKDDITILFPMNLDVAKLVMDKATNKELGNTTTIDHYVKSPQKLASDIKFLHEKTGADIVLGEFGAPIPDIHGNLTNQEQADWLEESLNLISREKSLIGLNYWTSFGGSTSIFTDEASPKPAALILGNYYKLDFLPNDN